MSWPRSRIHRGDDPDLEVGNEYTPSEIRAFDTLYADDGSAVTPPSEAATSMADPGVADVEQNRWRCVTCQSTGWDWDDEQYRCRQCGSTRFFDTSRPFRVDMADGIWAFEPRTPDQSPGGSPQSFDRSAAGRDEAPQHTTDRSPPFLVSRTGDEG